ncbi:MAG TPA: cytochrome P460 family protein [Steroidobacteraceae bacterium]|nr:cytochrome P460 family protein [Steroidobacteraceae bacterium]
MRIIVPFAPIVSVVMLLSTAGAAVAADQAEQPKYTPDGGLHLPTDYREWTYLTTGFDMSYSANADTAHHMFDNVFVNPAAYRAFVQTGTWPDGTMLVLEVRGASSRGSINRAGHYQEGAPMGLEVHVRDGARFPGKWAFFTFDDGGPQGKLIPQSADCYSCHAAHAAVDTTFVQFYPTLLPIARGKGTLARSYVAQDAAQAGTR